jgi:hypothetical protein
MKALAYKERGKFQKNRGCSNYNQCTEDHTTLSEDFELLD